jgi:hypothetical protein
MDIIKKDRNHIFFNPNNPIIPETHDNLEARDEEIEDPEVKKLEIEKVRQRQLNEIVSYYQYFNISLWSQMVITNKVLCYIIGSTEEKDSRARGSNEGPTRAPTRDH